MANKHRTSSNGSAGGPGDSTASRLGMLKKSRSRQGITWGDADADLLVRMVERVTEQGVLVSFSKTSDGGALCLYVKDQEDDDRQYAAHAEEIEGLLMDLYNAYEA